MAGTTKYDLEKFDRSGDFSLWKEMFMEILIHHDTDGALQGEKKTAETSKPEEVKTLTKKARYTIMMYLENYVLQ